MRCCAMRCCAIRCGAVRCGAMRNRLPLAIDGAVAGMRIEKEKENHGEAWTFGFGLAGCRRTHHAALRLKGFPQLDVI